MTEAQIENARLLVAINATPEDDLERTYREHRRWLREGRKGEDPVTRLAYQIADRVGVWESKYDNVASNSTVTTRDAVIEDYDGSFLITGKDAIDAQRRLDRFNKKHPEEVVKANALSKDEIEENERRAKEREATIERQRAKVPAKRAEVQTAVHHDDNTVVMVGRIMTLADFNRSLRARYDGTRAVRDHDLRNKPCRTLADINAVNHHRHGRSA